MTGRSISFVLCEPTRLLNETLRMHWRERSAYQRRLAWLVRCGVAGRIPAEPFERARLTVERRSLRLPDHDGLVGGLKSLIDTLLPPGEPYWRGGKWVYRHPTGLSIIRDDAPACLDVRATSVRVARRADQCTYVVVDEL